jgi:hypothetical protein
VLAEKIVREVNSLHECDIQKKDTDVSHFKTKLIKEMLQLNRTLSRLEIFLVCEVRIHSVQKLVGFLSQMHRRAVTTSVNELATRPCTDVLDQKIKVLLGVHPGNPAALVEESFDGPGDAGVGCDRVQDKDACSHKFKKKSV